MHVLEFRDIHLACRPNHLRAQGHAEREPLTGSDQGKVLIILANHANFGAQKLLEARF